MALHAAVDLARDNGARLHVVSAYEPASRLPSQPLPGGERREAAADAQPAAGDVDALLAHAGKLAGQGGVSGVRTVAREGDAADAILAVAEEQGADLIVVGNKGMTGANRFLLGSVPTKVSHHAGCSVLIVRTT